MAPDICELSSCLLLHPGLVPSTHAPIHPLPAALDHGLGLLLVLSGIHCLQDRSTAPALAHRSPEARPLSSPSTAPEHRTLCSRHN